MTGPWHHDKQQGIWLAYILFFICVWTLGISVEMWGLAGSDLRGNYLHVTYMNKNVRFVIIAFKDVIYECILCNMRIDISLKMLYFCLRWPVGHELIKGTSYETLHGSGFSSGGSGFYRVRGEHCASVPAQKRSALLWHGKSRNLRMKSRNRVVFHRMYLLSVHAQPVTSNKSTAFLGIYQSSCYIIYTHILHL